MEIKATELRAALETQRARLVEYYTQYIQRVFENLVKEFGADMNSREVRKGEFPSARSISNNIEGRIWRNVIQPVCTATEIPGGHGRCTYAINPARLSAAADRYATDMIELWLNKITGKMGEVEAATVHGLDWNSYLIAGTRNGQAVRIEQQMIINFSGLGNPYNQFPARLYVNGKAISAAAYKKMMAA